MQYLLVKKDIGNVLVNNLAKCKFCNLDGLGWTQDGNGRWKLLQGSKPHICKTKEDKPRVKPNWILFNCEKCGNEIRQNASLVKSNGMCIDCSLFI